MNLDIILFFILALFAVSGAMVMVTHRNPVYGAMGLVMSFLSVAGFYLLLSAPFLAAVQVIIYAGSIMTLFIFVIMLMDLGKDKLEKKNFQWNSAVAALLGFVMLLQLLVITNIGLMPGKMDSWTPEKIKAVTHTRAIAQVLYTDYLYPFEIISFILVAALVGAIILGKKKV